MQPNFEPVTVADLIHEKAELSAHCRANPLSLTLSNDEVQASVRAAVTATRFKWIAQKQGIL